MNSKKIFIEEIEKILNENNIKLSEESTRYFTALKMSSDSTNKVKFTENGKKILIYMQENEETYNNIFSAKGIGEGLMISSRGASGALRKLVTDGYVEKIGESPVCYSLTSKGKETKIKDSED